MGTARIAKKTVEIPTSPTEKLADILKLLAILKFSEDEESEHYVYNELRRYFAAERGEIKAR